MNNFKRCCKCRRRKSRHLFAKGTRRKDGLSPACKSCTRKYAKSHYDRNVDYYVRKAKIAIAIVREFVRSIKRLGSCKDCGMSYPPWVMDYDHRNSKQKTATVSSLTTHASKKRILKEIAKCDLVCANCH